MYMICPQRVKMDMIKYILPKDYFNCHLLFFKFFGLNVPQDPTWKVVYFIFAVPHFAVILTPLILEAVNIILSDESFGRLTLNVGMLNMHVIALFRLIGWFITREQFLVMVKKIKRSTFEFDIFKYSNIAIEYKKGSNRYQMTNYKRNE